MNSQLTCLFDSIASVIRKKLGNDQLIKASEFSKAIRDINVWDESGADMIKKIVYRDFENISNSTITRISYYAFCYCEALKSISFPACKYINSAAFMRCSSLTNVFLPECILVGSDAFRGCENLSTISLPKCEQILSTAFYGCTSLTEAYFPECSEIRGYSAFGYCDSLATISFPKCLSIGSATFADCRNLTSIYFPECRTIGSLAFDGCRALSKACFPLCTSISSYVFMFCSALKCIEFPVCENISYGAFQYCYNLSEVYLLSSSVCRLSNSSVFYSTPYTNYSSYFSGHPRIYVPASLVSSYQTATNWTYFSSYFYALGQTITVHLVNMDDGLGMTIRAKSGMTWEEWGESMGDELEDLRLMISSDGITVSLPTDIDDSGSVLRYETFCLYNDREGVVKTSPRDIVNSEHYLFSMGEGDEDIVAPTPQFILQWDAEGGVREVAFDLPTSDTTWIEWFESSDYQGQDFIEEHKISNNDILIMFVGECFNICDNEQRDVYSLGNNVIEAKTYYLKYTEWPEILFTIEDRVLNKTYNCSTAAWDSWNYWLTHRSGNYVDSSMSFYLDSAPSVSNLKDNVVGLILHYDGSLTNFYLYDDQQLTSHVLYGDNVIENHTYYISAY